MPEALAQRTDKSFTAGSFNFKLEPHEILFVSRRRQKLSQAQMAARYNLSLKTYCNLEQGYSDCSALLTLEDKYTWDRLFNHERMAILRRRLRLSQQDLADTLQFSRWWIVQLEQGIGECGTVVEYLSRLENER